MSSVLDNLNLKCIGGHHVKIQWSLGRTRLEAVIKDI